MRALLSALLMAVAGAAAAQTPDDFAWQWSIETKGDDGAHALVLDEAVYARISRADLRDLAVFNADGQPVPFAPLPWKATTQEERVQLNWLRLPVAAEDATAAGGGDSLSLRVERDENGRIRDLQLDSHGTAGDAPSTDLLIDLGERPEPVGSLKLTLGEAAVLPVNLRVAVLASDDLAHWRPLGSELALLAIDDNGMRIERLRLDFETSQERYLRLALESGSDWPDLARIEHERRETGTGLPDWRSVEIEGVAVAGEPGAFDYRAPGPLPVGRADVVLAAANTVAAVRIETRDQLGEDIDGRETDWWKPAAEFTAFRLGGSDEVRHLPADVGIVRDRHWRVHTSPALAQPPRLRLSYRPDRFVMLAQGPAPYRLFAGSARTVRPDYPVSAALAAAGAARPEGWQPPEATLRAGEVAAGDAVLGADRGPQYRRWALWAVLAIGAALVLFASLRVLRHAPADP